MKASKVYACERVDQKKGQSAGGQERAVSGRPGKPWGPKKEISAKKGDGQAENTVRLPFCDRETGTRVFKMSVLKSSKCAF
jgi:hypothetical protein